jgi:hypothetical protein
MLKSLARMTGFLAYFLITLEMLFMVTLFALYSLFCLCSVALRAFQIPRHCVAASLFSTSSLERDHS